MSDKSLYEAQRRILGAPTAGYDLQEGGGHDHRAEERRARALELANDPSLSSSEIIERAKAFDAFLSGHDPHS
jgi:hypothetical protein